METWKKVWRNALAPEISTAGLVALRKGLISDDAQAHSGLDHNAAPDAMRLDWPVEGACVIGYCAWQGDGKGKVGEVEEAFTNACFNADERLKEPAVVRHFLNWFDDTPRGEMRRELLAEVDRELSMRDYADELEPNKVLIEAKLGLT